MTHNPFLTLHNRLIENHPYYRHLTMKLENLLPDPVCGPLIVDSWRRNNGTRVVTPKTCADHEWELVHPNLAMRVVCGDDPHCEKCDSCNDVVCDYCMRATNSERGIVVQFRKCTIDKEPK